MSGASASRLPSALKIGLLAALYFSQGLPFGFQANALSLYLTSTGLSLEKVSLARLLALPWMLKALWAPLVDRHGSARFGRRKTSIIPMQLLLAATCVLAAFVPPEEHLAWLLVAVLAMNFFAATQDIAVDGLAVDLLSEKELGAGNAAQVVGYKVGMLTGGGLLVGLSTYIGWKGLFFAMAGLCLGVAALLLRVREPSVVLPVGGTEPAAQVSWAELRERLGALLRKPGAGWVLLAVLTYKVGESMADAMFGPGLMRLHHLEKETVAMWLGSWGMVGSLLGSLGGGVLATRFPLLRALSLAALLRCVPLFGQWALMAGLLPAEAATIVPVTVAEHLFGGILTTCMFAFMMSQVDRRIGATHYTLLASAEVLGKAPSALLSGLLVGWFGFGPVFFSAALISLSFLALMIPLRRMRNTAVWAP